MTPVVGIVLLVAITLLLASTVAAFALGLEDESAKSRVPTTAVGFEYDSGADDTLTIVHKSGEAIEAAELRVDVEGASCSGGSPNAQYDASALGLSSEFSGGETLTVESSTLPACTGNLDLSSGTVRVIWTSNAGTSTELQSWTGPG